MEWRWRGKCGNIGYVTFGGQLSVGVHHRYLLEAWLGPLSLSDDLVREINVVIAPQMFVKPQRIIRGCDEHNLSISSVVINPHPIHGCIKESSLVSSNHRFPVLRGNISLTLSFFNMLMTVEVNKKL